MLTRSTLFAVAFGLIAALAAGCDHPSSPDPRSDNTSTSASDVPWTSADVVTAAVVAKQIGAPDAPVVLHVGPEVLFKRGHVPGARHAGEAGTDDGLAQLEVLAKTLPKDRDVVVYCGCCPRSDCPNIRPAYSKLKALGFHVKVLDMPDNFRTDWEKKGFPVEKG